MIVRFSVSGLTITVNGWPKEARLIVRGFPCDTASFSEFKRVCPVEKRTATAVDSSATAITIPINLKKGFNT
jgi:hypothetical protein